MIRSILVRLLLFIETAITLPLFVVAWFGSSVALALVAGYRFAKLEEDKVKHGALVNMLGGKVGK